MLVMFNLPHVRKDLKNNEKQKIFSESFSGNNLKIKSFQINSSNRIKV